MRQSANQSKNLSRTAMILVLCLGSTAFGASNPSCNGFLIGYNLSKFTEKGKTVEELSKFPLGAWSNDSQFEGIIATDKVPADAELTIRFLSGKPEKGAAVEKATFETFSTDPKFKRAKLEDPYLAPAANADPTDECERNPKSVIAALSNKGNAAYSVRLTQGSKVICEQTPKEEASAD